ncbi:AAA family ATPase [bacterium]|nr:AAA family ATPase [bacterium]
MHLKSFRLNPEKYPTLDHYPFNLPVFMNPVSMEFNSAVTFFIGENGSGKSTLLKAIARRCNIHIWEDDSRRHYRSNRFETRLHHALDIDWTDDSVPGSFFGSQIFYDFTQRLDDWASANPGILDYFGGDSLRTKSHGQSLMAYFESRYRRKGLYLMDEPETALSPKTQLALLQLLVQLGKSGHAQFIIATHSPIIMACPGSRILLFQQSGLKDIRYEETEYFRIYRNFMVSRDEYINSASGPKIKSPDTDP